MRKTLCCLTLFMICSLASQGETLRSNTNQVNPEQSRPQQIPLEQIQKVCNDLLSQSSYARKQYVNAKGDDEVAKWRKELIVYDLKALKVLIDNGVTVEEPKLPEELLVPKSFNPNDEISMEEYHKREEAHDRWLMQVDLSCKRLVLTEGIVGFYSHRPYMTDELYQLATENIKDPATVKYMVDQANAKIGKTLQSIEYETDGSAESIERMTRIIDEMKLEFYASKARIPLEYKSNTNPQH